MKKFISLALATAMFVYLFSGITVSAANTDLVNVALNATVMASSGNDTENVAENAVDGNTETYFHTTASGKYAVYDLGRKYPISQIKFSVYTTADGGTNAGNAIRFTLSENMPSTSSDINNKDNFESWKGSEGVTEINPDVSNYAASDFAEKVFTYDEGEEIVGRYITVFKYYNNNLYFKDLEVYTKRSNIPELVDLRGEMVVSKYNGMTTGNGPENAIDGDETTYYENAAGGSGYVIYDLGATYKIRGIDMLHSREKNAISIALTKGLPQATDASGHDAIKTYCETNGDTLIEYNTTAISTSAKDYKYVYYAGEEVEARYVVICKPNSGSYKLYDLNVYVTPENSMPDDKPYNIADKGIVSASFTTGLDNMIDGDRETYASMPGNDEYVTIDLGAVYPIKRVGFVLANSNRNSSTSVVLSSDPPTSTDVSDPSSFETNNTLVAKSTFSTTPTEYSYAIDDTTVSARYLTFFQYYSGNVDIYEIDIYVPYNVYMSASSSVNIAKDKACFAMYNPQEAQTYPNVYWRAVDGDNSTHAAGRTYSTNTVGKTPRFIVDLGAEYTIDKIDLLPFGAGTTGIYVTNSNNFKDANLTAVATDLATTSNTKITVDTSILDGVKDSKWRYVVIDRFYDGGGHVLGLYELEVYSTVTNLQADFAKLSTKAYRITRGRNAYATGTIGGDLKEICDGQYHYSNSSEARVAAETGKRHYMYYDLGDSYVVPYVVVIPHNGYSGLNYGFDIVGANSVEDFTNNTCDTLATVDEYNKAGDTVDIADIWKIDISGVYAENKYRYIGIRGASGCQINVAEFEVFADSKNFKQAMGNVTATISALDEDGALNDVTVASNAVTTADGSGSYKVIVASYEEDGSMLAAGYTEITLGTLSREEDDFITDIKDIIPNGAHYIKVIIVDDFNNITPVMDAAVKTFIVK